MTMYTSTRNNQLRVSASQAILQGISEEGGLFLPITLPRMAFDWAQLKDASYQEIALKVLKEFLADFTEAELQNCIDKAYNQKYSAEEIVPLKEVKEGVFALELFHGPTIAFKDMALTILPHLMRLAAEKQGCEDDIMILTATSGDTGKAAMAGFADVEKTKIIVFYPNGGVSEIQEQQMVTQEGNNVKVVAIEGNFDDAQTAVKNIFNDQALKAKLEAKQVRFSSANSINIGRLTPQVAYYVWAYAQLVQKGKVKLGHPMDVVVPTGNFGNILAAYYAKQMGVPINKLICASNDNRVLVDFFNQREYDINRPFYLTSSPSMDILVSSNLERLVYELVGRSDHKTAGLMAQLRDKGHYEIGEIDEKIFNLFRSYETRQEEVKETIAQVFKQYDYLLDPHTAVAYHAYETYASDHQDVTNPVVIAATASPYKFPQSVMSAFMETDDKSDFDLIQEMAAMSKIPVPEAVTSVMEAQRRHHNLASIDQMVEEVLDFI